MRDGIRVILKLGETIAQLKACHRLLFGDWKRIYGRAENALRFGVFALDPITPAAVEQRLAAQRTRRLVGDQAIKILRGNLQIICSGIFARDVLLQVKFAQGEDGKVSPFFFRALLEKGFEFLRRLGRLVLGERQFDRLQQCLPPTRPRRTRAQVPFVSFGRRFKLAPLLEDPRAHGERLRDELDLTRGGR